MSDKKGNRYASLVGSVFEHGYKKGKSEFTFTRDQFVSATKIAMFALVVCDGEIKVAEERHYELVPAKAVTGEDLKTYSISAMSDARGGA